MKTAVSAAPTAVAEGITKTDSEKPTYNILQQGPSMHESGGLQEMLHTELSFNRV